MAVSFYTEFDFNIAMDKLKMKSKVAYEYVANIKKETWARHTFSSRCKIDLIVNNLSKSFNFLPPLRYNVKWLLTSKIEKSQFERQKLK